MKDFQIIPVLDLMHGQVVHGRAGNRDSYGPIESPFGPAHDPVTIAEGLVELTGADMLYLADLDAIQGQGEQSSLCHALKAALPKVEIWLDAGFRAADPVRACLGAGITPVIGSETLSDMARWAAICAAAGDGLVLSLDFDRQGFRGPEMLLADPQLWPTRVIVMTLASVGGEAGPDLMRLEEIANRAASETLLFAAGGIRGTDDLNQSMEAGAGGGLIATALHRGRLAQKEIAAFRRRRRSPTSNTVR